MTCLCVLAGLVAQPIVLLNAFVLCDDGGGRNPAGQVVGHAIAAGSIAVTTEMAYNPARLAARPLVELECL
jgi:hypothetical protein